MAVLFTLQNLVAAESGLKKIEAHRWLSLSAQLKFHRNREPASTCVVASKNLSI